ncbi:hypothetical protein KGQ31_02420 [Patescibacteria group bacterium]|nr:hypothetical protein [Patescibacteria group bacterium]
MSIENPFQGVPNEKPEKLEPKNKSGRKIGRWARKTAALAGAVGVGYFR